MFSNVWYSYVKNIVNGEDYNETVFIKGDGNATPATPEEIISLSKRKYGIDNETSEVAYTDNLWSEYLNLCKEYRQDKSAPTMKELQNEEIVLKMGMRNRDL